MTVSRLIIMVLAIATLGACGSPQKKTATIDEVTTRMNAADEATLDGEQSQAKTP